MELDAGDVLGEDPTLDRPDAVRVGVRDEGFEQQAADPLATQAGVHVDAVFQDARMGAAIGGGSGGHPANDVPVAVATNRYSGEWVAVQRSKGGTSVSNVAFPVAIPWA
jgi:hypothetical protein